MKQRLVGAVVLVSLAVIFIPMLLDGGEEGGMPLFGTNIPDKPDYQFEPLDIPLEPLPPVAASKPQLVEKPEPQSAHAEESEPATAPAVEEAVKPVPPQTGGTAEAPAPEVEPPEPKPVADAAWVVQLGSFSSSDNAVGLRDRLRGAGFLAFVEKVEADGETVYRVRVGPHIKREEAEAQLTRMKRELKLDGIVMGYRP